MVLGEDPVLLGGGQPGVEGQHVDVVVASAGQRVGGVVDLPLAAQEHQHVPRAFAHQLVDGEPTMATRFSWG